MEQSYYTVIPSQVRADKSISDTAKLLYGEISAKCNTVGFCWAKNDFFADVMGKDPRSIQRYIKELQEAGHITIEFDITTKGTERRVYLTAKGGDSVVTPGDDRFVTPTPTDLSPPPRQDCHTGGDSVVTHINIIDINLNDDANMNNQLLLTDVNKREISDGKDKELFNEAKALFLLFYKSKNGTEYYFTGVDGRKLKELLKKLFFKIKERGGGRENFALGEVLLAVDYFIRLAYDSGNDWLKANYSLTNLDTQFNNIIPTIKKYAAEQKTGGGSQSKPKNRGGNQPATDQGIIQKIYGGAGQHGPDGPGIS
jgi:hypothetical protein